MTYTVVFTVLHLQYIYVNRFRFPWTFGTHIIAVKLLLMTESSISVDDIHFDQTNSIWCRCLYSGMSFGYFGVYRGVSWAWNCYSWTSRAADASPGSDRSSALLCWQCGAGCYLTVGTGFWHCWPPPWPLVAQAQAKFQHQDQTSVNQKDCFNVVHFKKELKELVKDVRVLIRCDNSKHY